MQHSKKLLFHLLVQLLVSLPDTVCTGVGACTVD